MSVCEVVMWGRTVGAVSAEPAQVAAFQWDAEFAAAAAANAIEPAPLMMPVDPARVYRFPALPQDTFRGLPGMLADALPDRWGNQLISAWLASQGRDEAGFDAAERLCYTGSRGMGAMEFRPAHGPQDHGVSESIDVHALVELAASALSNREQFAGTLSQQPSRRDVEQILQLGTSAGGARPKALIAYNPQTGEVRSGQLDAPDGFSQWMLKFDGAGGGDHGLTDPQGWGQIEYAYSLMARAAGIEMTECQLLREGPRRHFMTRRFDRPVGGGRLHAQTLAALAHVDYNEPRAYSYERALQLIATLTADTAQVEQMVLRMAFNVITRNRDDHVKNTALLMDRSGVWRLSPAYDLTLAFEVGNRWLDAHQMTIAGKGKNITREDLAAAAAAGGVKARAARGAIDAARAAAGRWHEFAEQAEIPKERATQIAELHDAGLAG